MCTPQTCVQIPELQAKQKQKKRHTTRAKLRRCKKARHFYRMNYKTKKEPLRRQNTSISETLRAVLNSVTSFPDAGSKTGHLNFGRSELVRRVAPRTFRHSYRTRNTSAFCYMHSAKSSSKNTYIKLPSTVQEPVRTQPRAMLRDTSPRRLQQRDSRWKQVIM